MVAFDASVALAEFLADPSCTSLTLPHMTTGERKFVKKLVEQHPELACKSYGFGQERQLQVTKEDAMKQQENMLSVQQSIEQPVKHRNLGDLPILKQAIPVRNTFVHIHDTAVDERVIQSMPHGMFRQCVLSESTAAVAEPETQPTVYHQEDGQRQVHAEQNAVLGPGTLVVVEGLTKCPAFNGLSGVVQGWDEESIRFSVMLVSGANGCQQAKIKGENLRLLMPCP